MSRVNAHVAQEMARLQAEWDEGCVEGYESKTLPDWYYTTPPYRMTRRQRAFVWGLWTRWLEEGERR